MSSVFRHSGQVAQSFAQRAGAKMHFESKELGARGYEASTSTSNPLSEHTTSNTPMSNDDILLDVYFDLAETRKVAETSSDKFLLYLMDMAIFHVIETLNASPHMAPSAAPYTESLPAGPTGQPVDQSQKAPPERGAANGSRVLIGDSQSPSSAGPLRRRRPCDRHARRS